MMAVAIYSVIKNNQKHKLNFYIIHSSIKENNQARLKKLERNYSNTSIRFVEAESSRFQGVEVTNKNVTMEAYYRYLAPDILPSEAKALYLDFDMLCLGDLGGLYNTRLGDNYIGAVAEFFVTHENPTDNYLYKEIRKTIGLKKDDTYINSGLILMNLDLMRNTRIMDVFWNNIKNKTELLPGRTNHFADQTITNLTFMGRIKLLSQKYNVYTTALDQLDIKHPLIVHFTGKKKPLTYIEDKSSVYDDIYLGYYNECAQLIGYGKNHIIKSTVKKVRAELGAVQKELTDTKQTEMSLKSELSKKDLEIENLQSEQHDVQLLGKRFLLELRSLLSHKARKTDKIDHSGGVATVSASTEPKDDALTSTLMLVLWKIAALLLDTCIKSGRWILRLKS